MMLIVGPLLLWSQFRSSDNKGWQDAVTGAVAALVGMVPEGLVLLTSLAFTVAAVTLARKQTLVQELPAVEGLARVDVVCLDKTGTLTHGDIVFDRLQLLDGGRRSRRSAGAGPVGARGPTPTPPPRRSRPIHRLGLGARRRRSRSPRRASGRPSALRPRDVGARRAGDGAAGRRADDRPARRASRR